MGDLFEDDIRGKRVFKHALEEAYFNAKKVPQAILFISGFSKDAKALKAHVSYITRHNKVPVKNNLDETVSKRELTAQVAKWAATTKGRKGARIAMKMVLSSPRGTNPKTLEKAVGAFAAAQFGWNHDYAFVMHTDTANPHAHIIVKVQGYDGVKLNPRKQDLQQWREDYAKILRDHRIQVAATSRNSRGAAKKSEPMATRQVRQRTGTSWLDDAIAQRAEQPDSAAGIPSARRDYPAYYEALGQRAVETGKPVLVEMGQSIIDYARRLRPEPSRVEQRRAELAKGRAGLEK